MFVNIWNKIYTLFGQDVFYMEMIGSNLISGGVFWILCGLLLVVDLTGRPQWMLKYKTQRGKNQPVDKEKLWNVVKIALFNQIVVTLPLTMVLHWSKVWLDAPYKPEHLPGLLVVLRDLAMFAIFQEIGFYYSHRLVHWGPLYKAIHKQHHEWTAPIGVVAIYAHPVEHVVANVMPFVAGPVLMRSHMATAWLWYAIAMSMTVCHHCGYHLPLLPSPEFHDYHHLKFTGNYGVLGWLDYLHGTDEQFRNSAQFQRDRVHLSLTPINEIHPDGTVK